jgi:hypothetical protein
MRLCKQSTVFKDVLDITILKMNIRCSKHVEDKKIWIKTLIKKYIISVNFT